MLYNVQNRLKHLDDWLLRQGYTAAAFAVLSLLEWNYSMDNRYQFLTWSSIVLQIEIAKWSNVITYNLSTGKSNLTFRWIINIGGTRQSSKVLSESLWALHLGQNHLSLPNSFSLFWNCFKQSAKFDFPFSGIGSDRNMNASNLIDVYRQLRHFSVFLNCPWKLSTIKELFNRQWLSHDSLATSSSGRPFAS